VQSAKYGLTLLGGPGADRCATTIFYENDFSLDARIQAEARNHRIGQDQPVVYVDLLTSDIDRVVVRALTKKQDVATSIIDYLGA
jgi:SNF2 family DNA or RNA helicase